ETLYQSLLTRRKRAAWEAPHRFYEIGSFEGLEETRRYLASDAVPRNRPDDGAMTFSQDYLAEAHRVIDALDADAVERVVDLLADTRERQARLFILGVGGSAANASHAVNDFRKIAGLEAYACVIIPSVNREHVTPHTEAFQAVVWHLLVTHPRLKAAPTKWESVR